jgi:two-component system chemotaxis response regulator CheB
MSQVRVVRQRTALTSRLVPAVRPSAKCGGNYQMMGIVSSTGGPNAIAQLLGCLGDDFPLPILLVQHIGPKFLDGFAVWLRSISSFRVKVVETRECVLPGTIYLASQDRHLRAGRDYVETNDGDRVSLQRPSGTVLFESMASSLGGEALGVLLTGMGDDGAAGLLRIWQEGGHTIAEDESTAVVYGMPSEAVRLGGVSESLPLHAIAPRVLDLVHVAKSKI